MLETFKFFPRRISPVLTVLFLGFVLTLVSGRGGFAKETIDFSGYTWEVKHNIRYKVGPGPNYWSSSGRNVRVDEHGNLHLKIIENRGRWYSSEIWLDHVLGYGTYEFTVNFPEDDLNENVVFGLFNYLNDEQEFDIEISEWGGETPTNAGFVVQPADIEKNKYNFNLDISAGTKKVFSFTWTRDELIFRCKNCDREDCGESNTVASWKYEGSSLPRDDLRTHINLWLVNGEPPSDGEEVEVTVESFNFSPLGKDWQE